jgi:hypothetical protein
VLAAREDATAATPPEPVSAGFGVVTVSPSVGCSAPYGNWAIG